MQVFTQKKHGASGIFQRPLSRAAGVERPNSCVANLYADGMESVERRWLSSGMCKGWPSRTLPQTFLLMELFRGL